MRRMIHTWGGGMGNPYESLTACSAFRRKVAVCAAVALALPLLLLAGCSPRIADSVADTRVRVVYRDRWRHDSLYVRDSVYVKERVSGDTVHIIEYRDRWHYKTKLQRDTVFVSDTVFVKVLRTVTERQSAFARFKGRAFWALLCVAIAALVFLVIWILRRFRATAWWRG